MATESRLESDSDSGPWSCRELIKTRADVDLYKSYPYCGYVDKANTYRRIRIVCGNNWQHQRQWNQQQLLEFMLLRHKRDSRTWRSFAFARRGGIRLLRLDVEYFMGSRSLTKAEFRDPAKRKSNLESVLVEFEHLILRDEDSGEIVWKASGSRFLWILCVDWKIGFVRFGRAGIVLRAKELASTSRRNNGLSCIRTVMTCAYGNNLSAILQYAQTALDATIRDREQGSAATTTDSELESEPEPDPDPEPNPAPDPEIPASYLQIQSENLAVFEEQLGRVRAEVQSTETRYGHLRNVVEHMRQILFIAESTLGQCTTQMDSLRCEEQNLTNLIDHCTNGKRYVERFGDVAVNK
jgi:hypothetical protein